MVDVGQMTPAQIGTVQAMLREYLDWAFTLEKGSEDAPTFDQVDKELENLPGIFVPPKGAFLVAVLDGYVCGCVAMKPIDDTTCELKRLYVRPAARRHRAGASLVEALIHLAKVAGYKRIILDSHKKMTGAHILYRTYGFRDVDAPADFPAALKDSVVFMEKKLA